VEGRLKNVLPKEQYCVSIIFFLIYNTLEYLKTNLQRYLSPTLHEKNRRLHNEYFSIKKKHALCFKFPAINLILYSVIKEKKAVQRY